MMRDHFEVFGYQLHHQILLLILAIGSRKFLERTHPLLDLRYCCGHVYVAQYFGIELFALAIGRVNVTKHPGGAGNL